MYFLHFCSFLLLMRLFISIKMTMTFRNFVYWVVFLYYLYSIFYSRLMCKYLILDFHLNSCGIWRMRSRHTAWTLSTVGRPAGRPDMGESVGTIAVGRVGTHSHKPTTTTTTTTAIPIHSHTHTLRSLTTRKFLSPPCQAHTNTITKTPPLFL